MEVETSPALLQTIEMGSPAGAPTVAAVPSPAVKTPAPVSPVEFVPLKFTSTFAPTNTWEEHWELLVPYPEEEAVELRCGDGQSVRMPRGVIADCSRFVSDALLSSASDDELCVVITLPAWITLDTLRPLCGYASLHAWAAIAPPSCDPHGQAAEADGGAIETFGFHEVLALIRTACFLQAEGLIELACHRMCAHLLKQPVETLQRELPRLWAAAVDGFCGFSCQLSADGTKLVVTKPAGGDVLPPTPEPVEAFTLRSVPAAALNGACLDAEEARTSTTDRWLGARKAVGWEEFDAQALLEDEACLNELELHLINLDNDSVAPLLSHARDATLSRGNLGASRV